jgi:hypothetical protein
MSDPRELIDAQRAAEWLDVSVRTLGRYVARGLITPRRRTRRGPRYFEVAHVDALRRGECPVCGQSLADHPEQGHPAPWPHP